MGYRVFIEVGKGKNKATSGSTLLKRKSDVTNWVKHHPLGNYKTQCKVTNVRTGKSITNSKNYFMLTHWGGKRL